ncbi:LytTR family DNA-binding domain-containing protein [Polaribacter sp. MED152]|uniref:LytTR family DNA-binding domain-containing protein n=1 Tax=Polaribacter sp. MED152 TaxID=313598 RepID=UPI000068C94F|nr:LytTR family DNA-binding domain-containing protein [Polaribacter sp. MED152]EAQ42442.1 transcriptional regulator, LytTr family [Polaribacter sp. MED152]
MQWLNSPYPLLQNAKYKWLFALCSGIFVFTFLIVFEPYGSSRLTIDKYLFLAGFGVAVFLGVCVTYFILPKLLPWFFRSERWTIGREILLQSSCILIISAFNALHNFFWWDDLILFNTFLNFLKITISIGIFPIIGLIFFTERALSKRNVEKAQLLSNQLTPSTVEKTSAVKIQEESVKAPPIVMPITEFLYAQSEGNYVTIFHLKDDELRHKLIRLSLKQLEIQLGDFSQIKRCHRSYLINRQHIKSVDGNARSLTIQLDHIATNIPVSRAFSKADFH